MNINQDAVAHRLALRLADDTQWDQPPRLYWLTNSSDEVELREAPFTAALEAVIEHGVRLPTMLRRIADQLLTDPDTAGIDPDKCLGVAVRTEAWSLATPTDTDTMTRPGAAEAVAAATQAALGGRLDNHPDSVELAVIHAVTTDNQFHWCQWVRGDAAPTAHRTDLTANPPPGDIPRVLRRITRIMCHHQSN